MRAWLYYRLSRDEDEELNSLTNQRSIIAGYAEKNGFTIAGESFDDNVSGMHFDRDGIEKICEAVEQNQIDAVIVKDLSRLGRHRTQTAVFIDYCALPGFVDSKNEEKTERNAGYLVVSHSGGGMLRQGTRKGIRRTPANRGMRAHWVVKGLDISEDVCHGLCP